MLSESIIIWSIFFLLVIVIFIPSVLKFRKKQKKDRERKEEAVELGADKPLAQYPQIDYYRCIGCGACVNACPEGNVLGLVSGKATIINGLKCVGHGRCAEACPVNGIKIGLGDIKSRSDIPVLDDKNETNIPGLYVAGELAGLALIKNAINQGQVVVEEIANKIHKPAVNGKKDLIIIGAGPAGMSAALTAKKHNLNYLLLDQQGAGGTILQYPRKKIVMTRPVDIPLFGWLKKPEYSKEELLEIWEKIQQTYNIQLKTGEKLSMVEKDDAGFKIITQNHTYVSEFVVLALGRRGTPRKLNVIGEEKPKVMYKLMDAETYKGEDVLIVGGGDSAVEAAIGLAQQPNNIVTVSYRKSKFFRIKTRNEEHINELIVEGKIKVHFNSNIKEIQDSRVLIEQENEVIPLQNSYVFIFAGGEPPFPLMKKIGIRFGGEVQTSSD